MATQEYEKLYQDVIYKKGMDDDLYDDLMKKEKTILKTINKVVNQKENIEFSFVNSSLNTILKKTIETLVQITSDINNKKDLSEIFKQERRLYIGIMMTFSSIFLIILYKSDV
jgi:Iap family predicted aminopeptidase